MYKDSISRLLYIVYKASNIGKPPKGLKVKTQTYVKLTIY